MAVDPERCQVRVLVFGCTISGLRQSGDQCFWPAARFNDIATSLSAVPEPGDTKLRSRPACRPTGPSSTTGTSGRIWAPAWGGGSGRGVAVLQPAAHALRRVLADGEQSILGAGGESRSVQAERHQGVKGRPDAVWAELRTLH